MATFDTAETHLLARSGHGAATLRWTKVGLFVALIAALYAKVIPALVSTWWNDPDASYGLLIPPTALYLAWRQREAIRSQPAAPAAVGLLLVLAACLVFLAGNLGAELFLTRFSLVALLAGLAWTFWGGKRLKALAAPLLLLVTMIPLPMIVHHALAAPLQLFASRVAVDLLQLCGLAVYRDGNILVLPRITLGVAEACSGLRSLAALMVLALLIALWKCSRLSSRAALLALAMPIAIAVNVLRITGTAVLGIYDAQIALGFYHVFAGWLVLLLGFGMVLAAAQGLHALLD